MITHAFLTGSRVYGTPHEKSDTDLCVLVDQETLAALRKAALPNAKSVATAEKGKSLSSRDLMNDPGGSLYFDGLNLIRHTDPRVFEAWRVATQVLISKKPVTREAAVATIKGLVCEVLNPPVETKLLPAPDGMPF